MGSAHAGAPPLCGASWSAVVGGIGAAAAGAVVLHAVKAGPLSWHMAYHIASMNMAAPLIAIVLSDRHPTVKRSAAAKALWSATVVQMTLLWVWHSPSFYTAAQASSAMSLAAHGAFFLAALFFWLSVVSSSRPWSTMLALLVNGKLACLLGTLLIFAPRLLICAPQADTETNVVDLTDQHLAGLLMIAACPLSYVLAACVVAGNTLMELERSGGRLASRAGS